MKSKPTVQRCSKCNSDDVAVSPCEDGAICGRCLTIGRNGRDATTRAIRAQRVNKPRAIKAADEVTPNINCFQGRQTLPVDLETTSNDASVHRMELVDRLGTDCVALAVDSANSIQAANSHETMLCHQLAVAHKTALEIVDKGMLEADSIERARTLAVAVKFMDVFQRGLQALQRSRTGGEQRITIHHVSVGEGGQAIVGGVQSGAVSK